jgi:hypothetical protein
MSGLVATRLVVIVLGAALVVGGLAGVAVGGQSALAGAWGVVVGLVLIVGAVIERARYRSEHAEATGGPPGPGGGEPSRSALEVRFHATDERFLDPTTRRQMRVWLDPTTGERRYVAED